MSSRAQPRTVVRSTSSSAPLGAHLPSPAWYPPRDNSEQVNALVRSNRSLQSTVDRIANDRSSLRLSVDRLANDNRVNSLIGANRRLERKLGQLMELISAPMEFSSDYQKLKQKVADLDKARGEYVTKNATKIPPPINMATDLAVMIDARRGAAMALKQFEDEWKAKDASAQLRAKQSETQKAIDEAKDERARILTAAAAIEQEMKAKAEQMQNKGELDAQLSATQIANLETNISDLTTQVNVLVKAAADAQQCEESVRAEHVANRIADVAANAETSALIAKLQTDAAAITKDRQSLFDHMRKASEAESERNMKLESNSCVAGVGAI